MSLLKQGNDLETSDAFWTSGASPWPRSGWRAAKACRSIARGKQEESSPFLSVWRRPQPTQINLPWPLSFFHKIDLMVRFRFAGVRIRGHEEG
jgi:hypothetical protein